MEQHCKLGLHSSTQLSQTRSTSHRVKKKIIKKSSSQSEAATTHVQLFSEPMVNLVTPWEEYNIPLMVTRRTGEQTLGWTERRPTITTFSWLFTVYSSDVPFSLPKWKKKIGICWENVFFGVLRSFPNKVTKSCACLDLSVCAGLRNDCAN